MIITILLSLFSFEAPVPFHSAPYSYASPQVFKLSPSNSSFSTGNSTQCAQTSTYDSKSPPYDDDDASNAQSLDHRHDPYEKVRAWSVQVHKVMHQVQPLGHFGESLSLDRVSTERRQTMIILHIP